MLGTPAGRETDQVGRLGVGKKIPRILPCVVLDNGRGAERVLAGEGAGAPGKPCDVGAVTRSQRQACRAVMAALTRSHG
jgi:hypothetical protein